MNEREYRKLRQQIEDDAKRKVEALDTVWHLLQGTSNGLVASDAPVKRGTIDNLIRGVLPLMSGPFTPRDVMGRLQRQPHTVAGLNRSSISSALKRLADEKVITLVEGGKGKRPSVYQSNATNAAPRNTTTFLSVPDPLIESVEDVPFDEPTDEPPEPDEPDSDPWDEP